MRNVLTINTINAIKNNKTQNQYDWFIDIVEMLKAFKILINTMLLIYEVSQN